MSKPSNTPPEASLSHLLVQALAVVGIAFLVSLLTLELFGGGTQGATKIATLDHSVLMERKLHQVTSNPELQDMSAAEARAQGSKAAKELAEVLNRYAEAGYILVNRNAVIYAPPGSDLTEKIADRLDLPPLPEEDEEATNAALESLTGAGG